MALSPDGHFQPVPVLRRFSETMSMQDVQQRKGGDTREHLARLGVRCWRRICRHLASRADCRVGITKRGSFIHSRRRVSSARSVAGTLRRVARTR